MSRQIATLWTATIILLGGHALAEEAATQVAAATAYDAARQALDVWDSVIPVSRGWSRRLLPSTAWAGTATFQPPSPVAQQYNLSFGVSCSGATFSKQSCLFRDVCMQPVTDTEGLQTLRVFLQSSADSADVRILQLHLDKFFEGVYAKVECTATGPGNARGNHSSTQATDHGSTADGSAGTINRKSSRGIIRINSSSISSAAATFHTEDMLTMLWRTYPDNQGSFGHALINEAFPMFLVLQNHVGSNIPTNLQLLITKSWADTLQHVVTSTISTNAQLLVDKFSSLPSGSKGICFKQLLVGDGGYIAASRASLANSYKPEAHQYSVSPSFFSSAVWYDFRRHVLQANNITDNPPAAAPPQPKPLILLNDKRHGPDGKSDRRMIADVDKVTTDLQALYPEAEVMAVRFRDLAWAEQLRVLSRAKVFITTQGSSAFRLVFLPKGATCVMIGSPDPKWTEWKSFHELDRWFPLTYIQFQRYHIDINDPEQYEFKVHKGQWQPNWWFPAERRRWWLYNSDVRLDLGRLSVMVDKALSKH